ncbi:MAG: phenylalanine--tRNA ligase subunit beta [Neisseriaceae bacterium]
MKISFNWLKTWLNVSMEPEEIGDLLTMAGLEVENITRLAPDFSHVVVGEVVRVEPHPTADRLRLAEVDIGTGELLQVVCGASNLRSGIKVPCALVGALLPGNFHIELAHIRGMPSSGMLCSARELGLPEEEKSEGGLYLLPTQAPVGMNLRDYLDLDDHIFELAITPNRADCLSIQGIAREIGALTYKGFRCYQIKSPKVVGGTTSSSSIAVPSACGRMLTQVIQNIPKTIITPLWLKQRLERSGIKSTSFLVDVGNYVMLELGQPLHLYDFNQLEGSLVVRYAQPGEEIICLNDKRVALQTDTLVVADAAGPISIAGLMGGKSSSVSVSTEAVLIESAFFYPEALAGKARQYGLTSEAAYRFERGVDPQLQHSAIQRATELIIEYAGGQAGPIIESTGKLPPTKVVKVRLSRARKVLGIELDPGLIEQGFCHLGFNPLWKAEAFVVQVPSFRFDIQSEVDLIEEIVRLYGYEKLEPRVIHGELRMLKEPIGSRSIDFFTQLLAQLGYQEVINYSFVDANWEKDFMGNMDPIRILNPIHAHMDVMRSSLIPGLIHNLIFNFKRKHSRIRLFEVAKAFKKAVKGNFIQEDYVAGLSYGSLFPEQWGLEARRGDFFDIKNDVERLLQKLQVDFVATTTYPGLHPGRGAEVKHQGQVIGFLGELHPKLVQQYGLPFAPVVFELLYSAISQQPKVVYEAVSKFPSVRRDLAFVVPQQVTAQGLLDLLSRDTQTLHLQTLKVFDVYQGVGLPTGFRGLGVKIIFQRMDRTLLDTEVEHAIQLLIERAKVLGARLR